MWKSKLLGWEESVANLALNLTCTQEYHPSELILLLMLKKKFFFSYTYDFFLLCFDSNSNLTSFSKIFCSLIVNPFTARSLSVWGYRSVQLLLLILEIGDRGLEIRDRRSGIRVRGQEIGDRRLETGDWRFTALRGAMGQGLTGVWN